MRLALQTPQLFWSINIIMEFNRTTHKRLPVLLTVIGIGAVLGTIWLTGCIQDHGVDPVRTRITGKVVFLGPPPPEFVREARVVVVKKLPPDNILNDVLFSDPLDYDLQKPPTALDTIHYEIVADPGVYPAVGVMWRKKSAAWDIANILGIYTDIRTLGFKEVEVIEQDPITSNIDIFANWDLANRDAVIRGKINYHDDWPAGTQAVAVAALNVILPANAGFGDVLPYLRGFNINLKKFVPSQDYTIAVNSGEIKFLAIFWVGNGGLEAIRAVGLYHCMQDTVAVPKTIKLASGQESSNVNIDVNFSSLPVGVRYCKDCNPCP